MKKKINIVAVVYILLVYLAVATDRQKIYKVEYMSKYYIGVIICIMIFLLLIIKYNNIIVINKRQLYIAKIMFIPILITFIYTLFINIFNRVEYSGFLSRSFGLVAYCLLAVIQAYVVYSYFGKSSIEYTFIAIGLSYLTSIAVAFKTGGIREFINIITSSTYHGSVLEMHELAPIVALFLFYYLYLAYFREIKRKVLIRNLFICLTILILSMKRIVFLSCIIIIILFFVLRRKNKNLLKWIGFISALIIIFSYIYIYTIKGEYIYSLLSKYNINSMARAELWYGISSQYKFSITYLGRGLGFTSKWMDNNWRSLGINGLTQTTGLHNDILKFYIDIGFLGNLIFMINLLYVNTRKVCKKIDNNAGLLYFLLISLQILIWFTDNISLYHNFQWIFYLIIFSLLTRANGSQSD